MYYFTMVRFMTILVIAVFVPHLNDLASTL